MSQSGTFFTGGGGGGAVNLLTGNSGGAVGPDGGANINVIGAGVITIVGTPGTNTLTSSLINGTDGQVLLGGGAAPIWATLTSTGGTITFTPGANTLNLEATNAGAAAFVTDTGTANAAAASISILGGNNISTTGAAAVVTVAMNTDVTNVSTLTAAAGGNAIRTTNGVGNAVTLQAFDVDGAAYITFATLTASNTPTMDLSDTVTKAGGFIYRVGGQDVLVTDGGTGISTVPTNGQLLIGNGTNYAVANLTSTGSTIAITNGAGTINLESSAVVATTFTADGGTATPALNNLNVLGGTNITTSGAGSTITANLDTALTGIISTTFGTGGVLRTGTTNLDTIFFQAFDVDGAAYITFATLTASNVPTMDLSDAVTKAGNFIYRVGGQDVLVTDGGTGTSSTPSNGQLLIGNGANYSVASLTSTGATITVTGGAGTINLEAVNQNGASSFATDGGTATPATNVITIAGGINITTSGAGSTVTAALNSDLTGLNTITLNTGGALRTGSTDGNNAFLQAFNVSGASYTTFATLQAGNTPTMDLSDTVTKAGGFIYRVGGQDVSVADGGTGNSTLTAFSVLCGGTTTTAPVQSVASVGTAGQVLTSNGAGALPTFQAQSGFTWNEITITSVSTVVNNGYVLNNVALVTATLPMTAAFGDSIALVGKGVGGWRLAQNGGQSIHFGSSTTTIGVGGFIEFTDRRDTVEIICTVADTEFTVRSSIGNLTVV